MNKIYHLINGDFAIRIYHGESGYAMAHPLIKTQEQVDEANRAAGVTNAEAKAAKMCSMFNCWNNFNKLVEEINDE